MFVNNSALVCEYAGTLITTLRTYDSIYTNPLVVQIYINWIYLQGFPIDSYTFVYDNTVQPEILAVLKSGGLSPKPSIKKYWRNLNLAVVPRSVAHGFTRERCCPLT